ncbi:hypothetical protein [Arthrobacter sp. TMS1-12-1]
MPDTDELAIALPDRVQVAHQLAVVTRFLAVVTWIGVLAMLVVSPNGLVFVLLGVPLVVAAAAIWASRTSRTSMPTQRQGRATIKVATGARVGGLLPHRTTSTLSANLMVPVYYGATLAWVGVAYVALNDPRPIVLIAFPLLVTFAAYAANRHLKAIDTPPAP